MAATGAAGWLGSREAQAAVAEPPPETTTIKLGGWGGTCAAATQFAEDLLRGEGFTDVQYLRPSGSGAERERAIGAGVLDLMEGFGGTAITKIDRGEAVLVLAGTHVGCFELFVHDSVRTPRDLKGKRIAVTELGTGRHIFFAALTRSIGLDIARDVTLVTDPNPKALRLFTEGKVDGYMVFAHEPRELQAQRIGRVLIETTRTRPWADHYCCMVQANREWVRRHPVATKRALRAILKSSDVCARDPERVARNLVDRGQQKNHDATLWTLKALPYGRRRAIDAEATIRFWALRLREAGLIKASLQQVIAQGTDFRFVDELKRELKG